MKTIEHHFCFNPHDNGDEALTLKTKFFANPDPSGIIFYHGQELNLMSYGNSVTLNLKGTHLTPSVLRRLADELEQKEAEIVAGK